MKRYSFFIQNIVAHNKVLKILTNEILFLYFYIFSSVLWFFPFLGVFLSPICKVGFVWGAFLVIYQFLIPCQIQKSRYWYILLGFLISFCVSILLNLTGNFYTGIKHLIYSSIAFGVIATSFYGKTIETIKRFLYKFNFIFIIIAFWGSIISILMYVFSFSIEINYFGEPIRQGFIDQRLFGVYTSANTGATTSLLSIIFTFVNSYIKTGKAFKWKFFYWINFVIQYIYFSLTLSRGGMVTSYFALAIGLAIVLYPKLSKKNNLIKVFLKIIVIWIALTGSSMFLMEVISKNANVIPEKIESLSEKNSDKESQVYDKEIRRIETGDDMSNGRFSIWEGGIKIWLNSPIFGVVDARYDSETNISGKWEIKNIPSDVSWWLDRAEGNLHNQYIQVLVNSGIIGLLFFMFYAVLIAINYIKYLICSIKSESTIYFIIGLIFVVISSSAVNGLFETRLVFDRHNPFGLIFWLYLGIGSALIDNLYKKQSCDNKRIAFVCDTPLQIFNAINVKVDYYDNYSADLFVYNQFSTAQDIVKSLKNNTIFENVYLIEKYLSYSAIIQKFITLFRLVFPGKVIKKHIVGKISHDKYEYIALCFITPFTLSVFGYTKPDKVIQLEDGIGTYIGDIFKDYSSYLFKNMVKMSYYNKIFFPVKKYLYNPEIYIDKNIVPVIKIKTQKNKEIQREIERIFRYQENALYSNNKIVYLTQPWEREGFSPENEKKVLNFLRDKALVRVHPRQKPICFPGLNIDEFNNMWEIECLHSLSSDHILIGAFSTAQIMPKIIANKEPTLIFLYKLYFSNWREDPFWNSIRIYIEKIRGFYKDPSKVVEPEKLSDLQRMIKVENRYEKD